MKTNSDITTTTTHKKLAITGMGVITPQSEFLEGFLESALDGMPFVQIHEPAAASATPGESKTSTALTVRNLIRTLQQAGRSLPVWKQQQIALILFDDELPSAQIKNTLHLQGPMLQLSSHASLATGFQQARSWLDAGKAEAVLLASPYSAVFLVDQTKAEQEKQPVFALVEALGDSSENRLLPDSIDDACHKAIEEAGIRPEAVDYIEMTNPQLDYPDVQEFSALSSPYQSARTDLSCAAGSLSINNGNHQAAHEICRLVKTALCIYHRQIPAMPDWKEPHRPEAWSHTPFYVATDSRAWFVEPSQTKRFAAVNLVGQNKECTHVILSEADSRPKLNVSPAARNGYHLFLLAGSSATEILTQLRDLSQQCDSGKDLSQLAKQYYESYRSADALPLKAAILSHDLDELTKEIEYAGKSLAMSLEKSGEWQTPGGSYATATPLGRQGDIAFVYPGAFNSYVGIGRDLFRLFPRLHDDFMQITADPGLILRERFLYPRSRNELSSEQKKALEMQLKSDAIAMLTSGTALSILYTIILKDIFKVHPQAAFGYSLGENSMMFATGIWRNGDEVNACLEDSPLFHTRLAGPQDAVREFWEQTQAHSDHSWASYVLMVAADQVRPALQTEERVYLTHINTPRQVMIAGEQDACQRVIQKLGNPMHLQAPFNYALHCEAMRSEQDSLTQLHSWPVQAIPHTRLYTAAGCRRLPIERDQIAAGLGRMLCECVDFPRLVDQVYQDGARIFIEVGAGSNCAKWASDSLKGLPHLALSINRQGVDDHTSIMRLLAKLACHEIPLDLEPLFA